MTFWKLLLIVACLATGLVSVAPAHAQLEQASQAYAKGDYATALKIWREMADEGDAVAQYNVGVMYQLGQGVGKDLGEAAAWYQKAAIRGSRQARVDLATLYANGSGIKQNVINAFILLDLAYIQGHPEAKSHRETLAKFMSPSQIAEAKQLAAEAREGRLASALEKGTEAMARIEAAAAPPPPSDSPRAFSRDTVRQVQHALKKLGYEPGPVDGRMGPATEDAIARFQKATGMTVNGQLSDRLLQGLQVSFRQPVAATEAVMPRTGGCTTYADQAYDIEIKLAIPPPNLHEDVDTKTLTEIAAGGSGSVLGLASAQIAMSTVFDARFAPKGKYYCYWVDMVKLTLTISRLDVFVSSDYEPGSCEYNVIYDHEQEHVTVFQKLIRKYGKRFEFELTSLLIPKAHSPKLVRDKTLAQQDTSDLFNRLLSPLIDQLEVEINREQGKIDTIQEYRRLHRKCRNW